jgi:hypothetical protein
MADKVFLFLALAAILCSKAERAGDVPAMDGTDHFCKVWLKSHQ